MEKQKILNFLKRNGLCVISTSTKGGKPESAVMAFTIKDDFICLFNTEPETRKYKNLEQNKQVSVVVGGFKEDPSVQIDGVAEILEGEEAAAAKKYILAVHPEWASYFNSPTGKFIKVKPSWLRYSDFSKEPIETVEFKEL